MALSRMVRLARPRMSYLIRPSSSRCACSYCVEMRPSRNCRGTKFFSGSLATSTPAACTPVPRTDPSNSSARSNSSCASLLSLRRSLSSLTDSNDPCKVTLGPVGSRRAMRSPSSCFSSTRATSLTAPLAAIVINVAICATHSYHSHSCRRVECARSIDSRTLATPLPSIGDIGGSTRCRWTSQRW